ncbi:hypothetical protein L9F63_016623, partial [Diploptera punctata]
FVDFQLTYYGSPVLDFFNFLLSSASPEVLEDIDGLLDLYYTTLCDTLSKLGHEILQPSKQMLKSEWNKRHILGVSSGISNRAFALADPNHVQDIFELMKGERFNLSDAYKEAMQTILPLFKKWGWFDI